MTSEFELPGTGKQCYHVFLQQSLLDVGETCSTENRRAARPGGNVTSAPGDAFLSPVWFYDLTDAKSVCRIKSLQNSPKFHSSHSRSPGEYDLSVKCSGWNTASSKLCMCIFISNGVCAHIHDRTLTKQLLVPLTKNISRLLVYHEQDRTLHPSLEGEAYDEPRGPNGLEQKGCPGERGNPRWAACHFQLVGASKAPRPRMIGAPPSEHS